jgi:hypothetical protein
VLPMNRVNTNMVPDANIMDHIPMAKIMPFGMCSAPANPAVIAADSGEGRCVYASALRSGDAGALGAGCTDREPGVLPDAG